jgi:4-carboxymuconolactone decarboxylase
MKQFLKLVLFLPLFIFANESAGNKKLKALSTKEQAIIPISAFIATGELKKLEDALHKGLDAKLTINEIKEIFAHLYAYVGFPRSLNAQNLFMQVVETRQKTNKNDIEGKSASAKPKDYDSIEYGKKIRAKLVGLKEDYTGAPYQIFSPIMDEYLLGHLFGDIFVRDVLDYKTRELVTISALAAINGTAGQLKFHIPASMNMGLTKEQLEDFILVVDTKVGKNEAKIANEVLKEVLKTRK